MLQRLFAAVFTGAKPDSFTINAGGDLRKELRPSTNGTESLAAGGHQLSVKFAASVIK
jgi:hypothetical protein